MQIFLDTRCGYISSCVDQYFFASDNMYDLSDKFKNVFVEFSISRNDYFFLEKINFRKSHSCYYNLNADCLYAYI